MNYAVLFTFKHYEIMFTHRSWTVLCVWLNEKQTDRIMINYNTNAAHGVNVQCEQLEF